MVAMKVSQYFSSIAFSDHLTFSLSILCRSVKSILSCALHSYSDVNLMFLFIEKFEVFLRVLTTCHDFLKCLQLNCQFYFMNRVLISIGMIN